MGPLSIQFPQILGFKKNEITSSCGIDKQQTQFIVNEPQDFYTYIKETPMSNEKKITVYTKPNCVQCNATYRSLDQLKIEYNVVDLTQDPEAMQLVLSLGHKSAPIVVTENDNWSGFRPDKIQALAQ